MGRFSVIVLVLWILCLLSTEMYPSNGVTHCWESDRKALIDFKNGLIDPENRLLSWQGIDCCQWRGVQCDNSSGAVIAVDLHNPHPYDIYHPSNRYGFWNLSGNVDPALLRLKSLRHLDLSLNTFDGIPIPNFLGSLQALQYLNMSNAGFSGAIPPSLGNLSSLQYLDVSSNYHLSPLKTYNLHWVAGLSSLRYLDMNGVNLSIVGPEWLPILNRLSLLTELHLSDCGLTGPIPSLQFVNFTSLAVLDLIYNSFTSKFPDWIVNISSLVYLDISSSSLLGRIPLGISELPNLQFLSLASNNYLIASCGQLLKGSWRSIEVLDLSHNTIHGRLPSSIGNMTSLVDFNLFSNNIAGGIPSSIGFLCNLRSLDIGFNNLTGGLPEFLEGTQNCVRRSPLPSLNYLRLNNNRLVGNLPKWLGELHNLMELILNHNLLQGPIPSSIGELSKLYSLDVSSNQLTGTLCEAHFSKLSNLKSLFMPSNSLILNVSSKWVPVFQVYYLIMGSCQLGPSFPDWLETQKEIRHLDISNASISGPIPNWLWNISSNLYLLNASFNQLQGQLPNPLPVASYAYIDFKSNHLKGPIPLPLFTMDILDLSMNRFSGPIPLSIGDVLPSLGFLSLSDNCITSEIPTSIGKMSFLEVLDLSRNNLTGSIPSSLRNCSNLQALDLRQNNLSGMIPFQLGQLSWIQTLHLSDNRLYGELPSSLQNCSILETLDIGNNKFSGDIPPWIGERLTALRILRLRSNAFSGTLPPQLSNLSSLQVLDLANNNLVGDIPANLGDLQAMTQVQRVNTYLFYGAHNGGSSPNGPIYYEENVVISYKGLDQPFTKTLFLVTCIDLSGNNLVGEFPEAITNLVGLIVLNLSRNHINGHIPKKIANMHELESLDVSNNQLSGNIPLSMTSMTSLASLNFSNNNFSGQIPYEGQMTTFDVFSYYGNPGLCGPPLLTSCQSGVGGSDRRGAVDDDNSDIKDTWFYLSLGLGFATGILIPCVILAIKKPWSDAYFGFVDILVNRILQMCSSRVTSHKNRHRQR